MSTTTIRIDTIPHHTIFLKIFLPFFFLFNRSNHPSSNSISLQNEIDIIIPRYVSHAHKFSREIFMRDKDTDILYQKQTYRQQA